MKFKNKISNIKKRLLSNIIIIAFPIILYGLIGPLEIYKGNIFEFQFGLKSFLWIFLLFDVIAIIFFSVVLSCINKKLENILQRLIFAFAFLSYIQNMFLNKILMNEDGSRINWNESSLKTYTIMNLAIWIIVGIAILILPVIVKKNLNTVYIKITEFLLIIQIITAISMLVTMPKVDISSDTVRILSGKDQCSLAPNDNIIILVLDRFPNEEFERCIEENPELAETLKDFTYYNNADSHYNYTFPSLVHFTTGVEVDLSISQTEWVNNTWSQPKCVDFFNIMHDKGYTCNIYTDNHVLGVLGNVENLQNCMDNTIPAQPSVQEDWLCRLMLKMSIYKYSPYVAKPMFESNWDSFSKVVHYECVDGSIAFYNGDFYNKLKTDKLTINEEYNNMYSIMHLAGIHDPYNTDEKGNKVSEKESDLKKTEKGLTVILSEYINQLKELGVYDNATILIVSDHGYAFEKNSPQPIFLIKEKNVARDEMLVDDSPISLDDIQATVLVSVGYDNYKEEFGNSIYDWEGCYDRERELMYPCDGFNVYKYTGDRKVIKKKIEEDDYVNWPSDKGWY